MTCSTKGTGEVSGVSLSFMSLRYLRLVGYEYEEIGHGLKYDMSQVF